MCVTKQLISSSDLTVTCHVTYCILEHGTHHNKPSVCVASVGLYLCSGIHIRLNHAFFWLSPRIFISQTLSTSIKIQQTSKTHNSMHRLMQNRLYSVPKALLTSSGDHTASCSMGTFVVSWVKAVGA